MSLVLKCVDKNLYFVVFYTKKKVYFYFLFMFWLKTFFIFLVIKQAWLLTLNFELFSLHSMFWFKIQVFRTFWSIFDLFLFFQMSCQMGAICITIDIIISLHPFISNAVRLVHTSQCQSTMYHDNIYVTPLFLTLFAWSTPHNVKVAKIFIVV